MVGKALAKISGRIYLALIFIFLYAPIATLIVLSFNESRFRGKWGGFSLKWYESLLWMHFGRRFYWHFCPR